MSLCLLPDQIQSFKQALKEQELKIGDLLNMTTEERTKVFEKYAGDNAKAVNTLFEEKLVLKNKMLGLKNWASKVGGIGRYSEEGKAAVDKALSEYRAAQQERIFSPKENEAFLNDLADKKIGVHISRDVAQKIFELSSKAEELKNVNPKMSGVSDDYLKARHELENYVAAQKNTSVMKSIGKNLATIGRNNLLANPSTPLKTAISQAVNSTMDAITRRIATGSVGGLNGELVKQANAEAWDTFRKTGVNTASMEDIRDTGLGKLGEKQNFAEPAGAPAAGRVAGAIEKGTRAVASASNKVIIDWEHNYPFTRFYQKAFFDMTNLMSSNIAKSEGLLADQAKSRAAEIFKDAARIEPKTAEGAAVRAIAQEQAARITSTNKTMVGRLALGAKNWLNSVTPDFPLGDLLVPIAKIPANIIANGIENAGPGIPMGIKEMVDGYKAIQSTDLATRYQGMADFATGMQRVARTVGVMTAAAYFASQLGQKDFRSDQYGQHYVRLGNVWVNMEYVSAISPALAGFVGVKAGKGIGGYTSGVLEPLKNAPGINEAGNLITAITNPSFSKGIEKYASDFFTSRGEPAFIRNLLSGNPIEHLFFGAHGVETTDEVQKENEAKAQKAAASRAKAKQ